jgi:hypothetical protein
VIDQVRRYVIPAAFSVLPTEMASPEATVMLLAIGLQETRFLVRRQGFEGPARGFWQFEMSGLVSTVRHPAVRDAIADAVHKLCYPSGITVQQLHAALEHNDVLAAVCARCLLYTSPKALPAQSDQSGLAWLLYRETWRPGIPHAITWPAMYMEAWERVHVFPPPVDVRNA